MGAAILINFKSLKYFKMNGVVRPLLFEIMSYVPTVVYVMEIVSKAVQAKITQDSSWIQTFLEQNYD